MLLHDAIHQRRTIHRFRAEPVDEAVVERAILAAHQAPCHRLTWPWRFHVAGPQTREAVAAIAVAEKARKAPLTEAQAEAVARTFRALGALVFVSVAHDPRPEVHRENHAATAAAVQNLLLSLTADGVGSKWSTSGFTRAAETYALLQIAPEQEEIVAGVLIGVPEEIPEIPRPTIDAVARRHP
jgi:nitroreductase